MYLTQKCQIRDLSKPEFLAVRELCRLSKNLYNVGLYSVRQFYFSEQRYLRYESNYHQCKENENYKLLNTDIAQQTLKVVDRFKAVNQWFNKENARLQSIKDLQKIKGTTKRQARLTLNRNNFVRDYLNKSARYMINWCIEHKIGTVIIGVNPGIKQEINIGAKNNQNFVQIPYWSFRQKLKNLCERYGLKYQEQEESYTSKASFLDGDDIPVYNPDPSHNYQFSGKRVKRGLYCSQQGHLINADCNGAANIGKKSSHNGFTGVGRGCLTQPLRVKIS